MKLHIDVTFLEQCNYIAKFLLSNLSVGYTSEHQLQEP